MAIKDAERAPPDAGRESSSSDRIAVGRYTWREFLLEHGHADAAAELYADIPAAPAVAAADIKAGHGVDDADVAGGDVVLSERSVVDSPSSSGMSDRTGYVVDPDDVDVQPARPPAAADWERVGIDPATFLGFDPDELPDRFRAAARVGEALRTRCVAAYDSTDPPVAKGYYTWEAFEREFFLDADGDPPTDRNGEPLAFTDDEKADALGFHPTETEPRLACGADAASQLAAIVDERTVDVDPDLDEDAFFSTANGATTLANRYDLEKAVQPAKKRHFREVERYWVNEPYAFVVVFHSTKENEKKYYVIQPHLTRMEAELQEFLTGKLRTSIKYADESIVGGDEAFRAEVIADETRRLLDRFDLVDTDDSGTLGSAFVEWIERLDERLDRLDPDPTAGSLGRIARLLGYRPPPPSDGELPGIAARPEPAVLAADDETLTAYQIEKLLYYLKRDFIGYERIDPIKHDINVEDISCDGYESPVFVYHTEYEQIITNVHHGIDELDDFVVKLAQRSGKGISKRRPQVDATLPDGSRAQLTLGREVSDHGTNYTIRQFNDVPFTPVDLINWNTFSLDQMAFLWLCIENHKSLLFAGGTASGKTTSLNAVSLFIPSNAKIVSIEDTREVELPQRNWIASVTRPSFSEDDKGDVDEFDLLEAALRQRPDYIVMGEIRGEEGRTAFQVMSTGHTTYTTFHADSVGEVLKRFTTDPINVSKTMFTALDLVSIQSSTRVGGRKVRRNKSLTEINHYDAENDEINVQDVYQWQAETDEFLRMGDSNTLEEIMFDRGWNRATLDEELRKRRVVLAYLIDRGLNTYAEVAATFQAFINDPDTILALMATDGLERSLADLREMESVLIDVDPETEAMVPRPDPGPDGREEAARILEAADDLLAEYRGERPDSVADALLDVESAPDVEVEPDDEAERDGERSALDESTHAPSSPNGERVGAASVDGTRVEADPDAETDPSDIGNDTGSGATGEDDRTEAIDFDEPFDEGTDVMRPAGGDDPGVHEVDGSDSDGEVDGSDSDTVESADVDEGRDLPNGIATSERGDAPPDEES